jgi:hypothetical protein
MNWLNPQNDLHTKPVEEHVVEGIPENEPYIIYYDPESASGQEEKIIQEPEHEPEPENIAD